MQLVTLCFHASQKNDVVTLTGWSSLDGIPCVRAVLMDLILHPTCGHTRRHFVKRQHVQTPAGISCPRHTKPSLNAPRLTHAPRCTQSTGTLRVHGRGPPPAPMASSLTLEGGEVQMARMRSAGGERRRLCVSLSNSVTANHKKKYLQLDVHPSLPYLTSASSHPHAL